MTTPEPPSASPAATHILIVEDEEIVLFALKETLRREGYQVTACLDAMEALEVLKKQRFAVILTDYQMPMLTGVEFLVQAKQLQPEAARVLVTASLNMDRVIDAVNEGEVCRVLTKPWVREDLLATVRFAVQHHETLAHHAPALAATAALVEQLDSARKTLEERVHNLAGETEGLRQTNAALTRNFEAALALSAQILQRSVPGLRVRVQEVQRLGAALAGHLQLAPEERSVLAGAAALYDVGLAGLPPSLLERWLQDPATLSEPERALVEQHPALGEQMTHFSPPFDAIGPVIRAHHERFDGAGYPGRLAGERIPWLARLLAVAVGYAHSPLPEAQRLAAIQQASGTAFDPTAVRALAAVLTTVADSNRAS